MVFQSYALYPHLSVYENMAFALKLAKQPKAEVDDAVDRAAAILGIEQLLERKPAALSGGQRQRVAIGRAIVRQPDVFLFDEPLVEPRRRASQRMRFEFAALHRQLGTTTVYVTHDQVEAMTLADRIVVMREGGSSRSAHRPSSTPARQPVRRRVHRVAADEFPRQAKSSAKAAGPPLGWTTAS